MGLVRKTASILTLGVVNFRSTKERLERAERGRAKAELELLRKDSQLTRARERAERASRGKRRAELDLLATERRSRRRRRWRRRGRAAASSVTAAADNAQQSVRSALD